MPSLRRLASAPPLVIVSLLLISPSVARADRDGEGRSDMRGDPPAAAPPPAAPPAAPPPAAAAPPAVAAAPAPAPAPPPPPPPGRSRAGEPVEDRIGPRPASTTTPSADESAWDFGVFGFLRIGYENVQKDNRYEFIGRNNGFVLDAARLGLQAEHRPYRLTFRISAEGASDVQTAANTPSGTLDVRLRDAFVRWDANDWLGVQVGQFKAPWAEEELRGTQDQLFASRAVGFEGVLAGRGFQERGLALDRQLGVALTPKKPIGSGEFGFAYYAMIMNGNGQNQLLDDNGKPGLVGRLEGSYAKVVRVGAGGFLNDRRVGAPPNLYDEEDLGVAGDVSVHVQGLEVLGQVAWVRTRFPTVGAPDRAQLAYHGQIGYRIETPVPFAPAYRYAHYDPWASGGDSRSGQDYTAFRLDYHTVGVKIWHPKLRIAGWIDYTFTIEPDARKLDNNRLQILGQLTF